MENGSVEALGARIVENVDRVLVGKSAEIELCAIALLSRMKSLGVHVAIDDFGTGYSSLSYLLRLPADTLKIDRSFVSGTGDPQRNASIVRTVVGLAYSLGMDVVAEGVETEEQRAMLADLGCPLAQGFLFSPAVDADAAREMLAGVGKG